MPVSESQKQGGALGCRFSEKAEHVPIKKRRFLFRSPSPPPEETSVPMKSEEIAAAIPQTNLCSNDKNVSIGVDNTVKSDGQFGEGEDFSGISILAAAACSSSLGSNNNNHTEHGLPVEDSSVTRRPCSLSTNINAASLSKEFSKEELLSSSDVSTAGTLSCISTEAVGELVSISNAVNLPPKVVADINNIKDASIGAGSCQKDEEIVVSQGTSAPDVKFHWDLNVVMDDTWEEPLNDTQNVVVDNNDSHDKQVIACTEQRSVIPDEVRKGNQDPSGERSFVSCSNSNLSVVKCVTDETKFTNSQTVDSTSSDHATKLSTSDGLNLNGEKSHYNQQGMVDDSRVVLSSCKVENLSTISETVNDVAQNVEFSKDAQGSVSDEMILPKSSRELQNSFVSNSFSENPLMVPKEPHDSQFGETSQGNMKKCSKPSTMDDIAECADYDDDVSMQDDFESQYEDGELRESTELQWKEYDEVDREHEHVDYGSDNTGTFTTYPSDFHDIESGYAVGEDCYLDNTVGEDCQGTGKDDKLNSRHLSAEKAEVLGVAINSKNASDGVADDHTKNDRLSTHVNPSVNSKGIETKEEPKVFRRPLQSRIEGPISRDGTSRDDRPFRPENRFESGSTRSFERGRHSYHNRGRGRQGGNWDGPSDYQRGCKRHYSPINNRRSKLDDNEDDDFGCDGNRGGLSYSRQHQNNRTDAVDEPNSGLQSRYRSDRKFSPDRGSDFGRGRPFRYNAPFDDSRGGRGRGGRGRGRGRYDHNRVSPDESFQSSLKHRRPLSRRERSFSPFGGRGHSNINHSRGTSPPPRSRSRSPIIWDSTRERPGVGRGNRTFVRHRSRSPNFRSPNHQSSFRDGGHVGGGFRSITRTHSSPPRNRWNSDRRDDTGNCRDFGYKQRNVTLERSPDRNFHSRGDRDSFIGSPRNLKSDGYSRLSDRISEDCSTRGPKYAGNYEERRKPSTFIRHPRRDYDSIEDDFSNSNRNRDPPRFRGRGGFIGDTRKSFRGGQQSEDHMGRYNNDMGGSGTNQGNRYNYEDRRKQYNTSNYTRNTDNERKEERLNRNSDENFQDAPDYSGNDTRLFGEQSGNLPSRLNEDSGGVRSSEIDANVGSVPS